MSDLLSQLQLAAQKALSSSSTKEGMKHLATAFLLFSKETTRLQNAYSMLQKRFNMVNDELEKTNSKLRNKISDLKTISNYLNNILKNISQGILFVDADGIVTTYNEAAQKILENEEKHVLFSYFWDNFSDDFFGFSLKAAINFQSSNRLNYINIKTKSETKEIEISTSYVFDCPKESQGIIIILRDITNLKKLHVLANRNDRMKELGEMAAAVAHEIKNPLGAIRGYSSLLYRDLENSKYLQDMASYILEGSKSLERLVNNVLHFTRPIQLNLYSIDLVKLIQELIKSISIDPSFSKQVKIDLHISENELFISADKHFLRAAFLNLFVNAYQAMEDQGNLSISVIKNNDLATITISDNGNGIEESVLEKIFSPFFTTKQKGNGLGLSEAYKIIQAHFGTIDVRSIINKGSTFSINLPIKRNN